MSKKLSIAFIGLGSIARRHIKNLVGVLDDRDIEYVIDVYRHSLRPIEDEGTAQLVSHVYLTEDIAMNQRCYDIVFVTNPTAMHYDTIKDAAKIAKNLFIEKPIFDSLDYDVNELGIDSDAICYVACPLRYNAVLQYIKENVNFSKVFSVRAISSSYLPDWRSGQDYRDTYSAHKSLGGGVAMDLIHEWDYITSFLGMPKEVSYFGGTYSNLEIDSDDLATYIGVYDNCIVELHLDYFGRKTIRELMIFTQEETIRADIANGRVECLNCGKILEFSEERDAYQKRELEHFLDIVEGKAENDSDINHGLRVLALTKGIVL